MFESEYQLVINGNTIRFSEKIASTLCWNAYTIVLLELHEHADNINNIYALRNEYIAWQIQDQRHYNPKLLPYDRLFGYYAAVAIYDKNPELLIATDTGGFRYLVDPTSGLIVGQESWVK